ncbi:unannotated protein [freshwater metagenome]|uniref:Unannotated protein n=1 Tax=freshwater metagenome TaxID=449393 RepID=A0A6J6H2D9_9ZZZZ
MGERLVRVRAGEEHQHIGTGSERAPGLDAVDQPATLGGCGGDLDAGHIGSVIGFGHGDSRHDFGGRKLRQPLALLFLGATGEQGAGQDLRTGDERTAGAERGLGEFFGGHDHPDVFADSTFRVPVVLDRHGQAESTEFGESLDEVLGDVGVGAMDVLGDRNDLVVGESAERVLHEFEVTLEMARAGCARERCQELRSAVDGDERASVVEYAGFDAPLRLAAEQFRHEFTHGVGNVGARDATLEVALGSVGEHGAGGFHGGGSMGHVVGENLILVRTAVHEEQAGRRVDDAVGVVDNCGSGGEVRCNHGTMLPMGSSDAPIKDNQILTGRNTPPGRAPVGPPFSHVGVPAVMVARNPAGPRVKRHVPWGTS